MLRILEKNACKNPNTDLNKLEKYESHPDPKKTIPDPQPGLKAS
jgi:hypothetical protein